MGIGLSNILCLAAGAGVALAGLGVLWGHRISAHEGGDAEVAKRHWAGPSWLTQQMRLVLGASCLIGGYHVAAYGSPDGWFPLKAPREIWWVVPVVIVVCLAATLRWTGMSPATRDETANRGGANRVSHAGRARPAEAAGSWEKLTGGRNRRRWLAGACNMPALNGDRSGARGAKGRRARVGTVSAEDPGPRHAAADPAGRGVGN